MPAVPHFPIAAAQSSEPDLVVSQAANRPPLEGAPYPGEPAPGTGGQTVGRAVSIAVWPPVLPHQAAALDVSPLQNSAADSSGDTSTSPLPAKRATAQGGTTSSAARSAPIPDGRPTAISSLKLDGGTAFLLSPGRTNRAGKRAKQGAAPPPRTPPSQALQAVWASLSGQVGTSVLRLDLAGWGRCPPEWLSKGPACECRVTGPGGRNLHLHFVGQAHVILDARTGSVHLEAKAPGLWTSGGFEAWAERWLALATWLARAEDCSLGSAHRAGWRTVRVELCSDFVGFPLRRGDSDLFTASRLRDIKKCPPERLDTHTRWGNVETIAIGTRKSPISMSVHLKSVLLRDVGKVRLADSIYAHTWRESPAFHDDADVTRVEFRLSRYGLTLRGPAGVQVDLRDPAKLACPATLASVWGYATHHFRLVAPPEDRPWSQARKRRYAADERWKGVQDVGSADGRELKQFRDLREKTHAEQVYLAARDLGEATTRFAAYHNVRVDHGNVRALAAYGAALGLSSSRVEPALAEARVDMLREENIAAGRALPAWVRAAVTRDDERTRAPAAPGPGVAAGAHAAGAHAADPASARPLLLLPAYGNCSRSFFTHTSCSVPYTRTLLGPSTPASTMETFVGNGITITPGVFLTYRLNAPESPASASAYARSSSGFVTATTVSGFMSTTPGGKTSGVAAAGSAGRSASGAPTSAPQTQPVGPFLLAGATRNLRIGEPTGFGN